MPNPFFDKDEAAAGMTPAAIGYRYRKFQLGWGIIFSIYILQFQKFEV